MAEIAKRWSGADWADCKKDLCIIGLGGIGSWTALSLARIDHNLILIDGDTIDATNVSGGQMYRTSDIGKYKVNAIKEICRSFGCSGNIIPYQEFYSVEKCGVFPITICGLDNMKSRKEIFTAWKNKYMGEKNTLFIDGRLLLENMEIFCIQGEDENSIEMYEKEHLFDDSEVADTDCTVKQCTFSAMGIASIITASVCNWLTNNKLGMEMRDVPFYQSFFMPIFNKKVVKNEKKEIMEAAFS